MLIQSEYKKIRKNMQPGDIIAFDGEGFISNAISFVTRCPISHVGIVLHSIEAPKRRRVELMESTTLSGKSGVQLTKLSSRLATYPGKMWWLPLSDVQRKKFFYEEFTRLADEVNGRSYDKKSIAHFFFDRLRLWSNSEDPSRLFCSELAAYLLKAARILPIWFNSSDFRPHDLVNLKIYAGDYHQLVGLQKEIRCYNRMPIDKWKNK